MVKKLKQLGLLDVVIVVPQIRCLRCSWTSSYRWIERLTFIFSMKFVFVGCIFYTLFPNLTLHIQATKEVVYFFLYDEVSSQLMQRM